MSGTTRSVRRFAASVLAPFPWFDAAAQGAGLVLTLVLGGSILGLRVNPLAGVALLLGGLLVLSLIAGFRLQHQLEENTPNIAVKPAVVFDDNGAGVVLHDALGNPVARAAFVHFRPANQKPPGVHSGAEAHDVHAVLRVLTADAKTELVPEMQARWVEADEQLIRGGKARNAAEVVHRDLPANGRPYANRHADAASNRRQGCASGPRRDVLRTR